MPITEEQVRYVAHLSRLALTDNEVERFSGQLGEILGYVEKLNELDTSDVDPLLHALDTKNVFREDSAGESLSRKDIMKNAPESSEGCYKVPRIIE